jgi:hypothetical protein
VSHDFRRAVLGVGFCLALAACNAEPPRRPGTTTRNVGDGRGALASTSPDPLATRTSSPAPGTEVSPQPTNSPAPGDQVGNQSPNPGGGGAGAGGTPAPTDQSPTPGSSSTPPASPPPSSGSGLTYRVFYKQAEPNVANKRHGGWNLDCLSMNNSAGTRMATSICNKKLSNSCQVYHAENYGSSKSVTSDLVNGAIEVRMTVTSGAQYCPSGATDDVNGFRYVNPDGSARAAETYSTASSAARFKCGKQTAGTSFKYKVCFEDALESAQNIPGAWDFNDFIVIIDSSKDVGIAGISCNDTSIMQLPDSTCL